MITPGDVLMGITPPTAPVVPEPAPAPVTPEPVPVTPEPAPAAPVAPAAPAAVLPDLASVQAALEVFRQVEAYLQVQ